MLQLIAKQLQGGAQALLLISCGAVVAAGCGSRDTQVVSSAAQAQPAAPSSVAASSTTQQLFTEYLSVHQALAADNVANAKAAFARFKVGANAATLSDAGVLGRALKAAGAGAAARDLDAARRAFSDLSAALIDWLKAQPSPAGETLHLANCPMAFGTGAKWLQRSDKVQNPYYGSEMPSCGSIDADVKPGSKLGN